MKAGWRTRAIGRHLVDLPGDAKTIETYSYNKLKIALLPEIKTHDDFDRLVAQREQALRAAKHETQNSMFVDRARYANGSVTLISWDGPDEDSYYRFFTYFRVGSKAIEYSGNVAPSKKQTILASCERLSREWSEIPSAEMPQSIGYVADCCLLRAKRLNFESWRMSIQLAGKPDVSLETSSYTQGRVGPGLRERAGGAVAGLLDTVAGLSRLRNRARPVGPIEADEILLAGTQDGKRCYGFKWEAPGKANSLAEPNLNVTLEVMESVYTTNKESFASDEEAPELWDAVVDSIRLRPGAV